LKREEYLCEGHIMAFDIISWSLTFKPFRLILFIILTNIIIYFVLKIDFSKQFDSKRSTIDDQDDYASILKKLLRCPIPLAEVKSASILKMLADFFLVKWHFFKNSNSLNTKLIFRSFLLALNLGMIVFILLFFIFTFILKTEIALKNPSSMMILGTVPFLSFWHQHTVFHRKWKHVADMIEKYVLMDLNPPIYEEELSSLEGKSSSSKESMEEYKIGLEKYNNFYKVVSDIEHSIVIDLLHLDLWFHKSFHRHFINIVTAKINSLNKGKQFLAEIKKFELGKYTEQDVEKLFRSN
jgi:hypothetical protein